MAGHTIAIFLKEQGHKVRALTRKPFPYVDEIRGDVTDFMNVKKVIENDEYDAVINCVGLLIQEAETQKHMAVLLNSYLPHYLSFITKNMKTLVIHISTDCVFSGKEGSYTETSFRDGGAFYDRSKALGELENDKDLTFRTSLVGPDMKQEGVGLFNWFMKQNSPIKGYTNAIWTGVTTLTIAKAMEKATKDGRHGLFNLVNNSTISKLDLLRLFNKHFRDNGIVITPDDSVRVDKSLANTRSDSYFSVPSYESMIQEMKNWITSHKSLYPHYLSDQGDRK